MTSESVIAGSAVVICRSCSQKNRVELGKLTHARCGICGDPVCLDGSLSIVCRGCGHVADTNAKETEVLCPSCDCRLRPCPKCGLKIREQHPPVVSMTTNSGDTVEVAGVCRECYAVWMMMMGSMNNRWTSDPSDLFIGTVDYMEPESRRLSAAELAVMDRRHSDWTEWIEHILRLPEKI